ncbi:F0F1 ATP synthase subunit epsilon [Hoeflea sp. WL0058]|uniref:ATP synthase epsilon chain n=1 Tax=Flavimaribacter sediminis TaxID=2865987 RepID=A0AAE2ZMB5_9HYPH|nr:F0F1 ATP synthase subunit epsilon [Flavimaribacter sediminis]MBW8638609.1 F0F1 ATP synthase subunit epsilon [Flavimaribacter sediminis]
MADSFNFELVSPEQLLLSEAVSQVIIPGSDGEMTVMAHHAPTMTTIKPGIVSVTTDSGENQRYVVFGGFADILPDGCTLLAESAVRVEDIDHEALKQRIQDTREDLADAKTDADKTRIAEHLNHLETLQNAV